MAQPRRFRFGVQVNSSMDGKAWLALAQHVEELGYSTLLLPDHFGDQLAPIPALAAAAAVTTTLRVGALVFANDFRHPAVLAKEIATLDVLSSGRVEFGLGAGWLPEDYAGAGIAHDPPGTRIARMAEALDVMKGLWSPSPVEFAGHHYTIDGLQGLPHPVQLPHPPILIGGGSPKVLALAAKHADIIGINPSLGAGLVNEVAARDAVAARLDAKVAWVREAAGDRFVDVELNILVFVCQLTDDRYAMAELMAPGFGVNPDEALEVPYVWAGTVDQICEHVQAARARWGFSYFVIHSEAVDAMAPVVARLAGT
jgi:probable F420-dependent oxidoreductase